MNLDMIQPRNETEDLILSKTMDCETLIDEIHTKSQKTLEVRLTHAKETFAFKPSNVIGLGFIWMITLTSLEVYNSFFKITEENIKFEKYTDLVDEN